MTENTKMDFGQKPVVSMENADAATSLVADTFEGSEPAVRESVLDSVSRVIDTMRLNPDQEEKLRTAKAEAARLWEEGRKQAAAAESGQAEPVETEVSETEAADETSAEETLEEVDHTEETETGEEQQAAVIFRPDQSPARINVVKFGVQPILPYSIEEAINRLRINISFLGSDVKKIMVVSSEPNEGKSFVAMNLWKQMAVAGESTVLLDLDMRKSTMAAKYQLTREDGKELQGTSHYLAGDIPIEDMILHTDMPTGDILPNVDNIVNPSMLFESRKFTEMMTYCQDTYRYIFVDVPPLGLVSDGELIGSVCDGAVLCVRGGVTSRGIVRRSIQQLERAGCPVLGIVLNRVGGSGSGYYHKYYGKKYYYNDQYYSKG